MISSSAATENMIHMDRMQLHQNKQLPSSSRILDIPCKVCGDFSSGKHYNIFACDGCAGFFKRSIRRNRQYICKAKVEGSCIVDKTHRNQCRACRLTKCQEAGMNKDAVQHERGPRNSTLRRQQMAHFLDPRDRIILGTTGPVDLVIPRSSPAISEPPLQLSPGSFPNYPRLPISIPTFPILLNPEIICESAAKILFINVQWTKNASLLTSLPMQDQLLLLEESWKELFILGASQILPLEFSSLINSCGYLERNPNSATSFLQQVKEFQDILTKIAHFRLDQHELDCLKVLILFKTNFEKISSASSVSSTSSNDGKSLTDPQAVASVQERTQFTLNRYLCSAYPDQPLRFGKLMMLLPTIRNVSSEVIVELFFRKAIEHIPIVRIICDMYKTTTPRMI